MQKGQAHELAELLLTARRPSPPFPLLDAAPRTGRRSGSALRLLAALLESPNPSGRRKIMTRNEGALGLLSTDAAFLPRRDGLFHFLARSTSCVGGGLRRAAFSRRLSTSLLQRVGAHGRSRWISRNPLRSLSSSACFGVADLSGEIPGVLDQRQGRSGARAGRVTAGWTQLCRVQMPPRLRQCRRDAARRAARSRCSWWTRTRWN
jgi:hypothetical protein